MDTSLITRLHAAVADESHAVIRCLVAAEKAVEDGRFNIAKVMRAAAHAARIRAMNLQRLLAAQASATLPVEQERIRRHAQHDNMAAIIELAQFCGDEDIANKLEHMHGAMNPLNDILDRSVDSLSGHRDVMESEVAQLLWGCQDCGYMAESERPDLCPQCGALGGEFARFGPFYNATDERLGRRRAEEIISILQESPDALVRALEGTPEEILRRYPTQDEWCMKEIAGHMIDVTEVFLKRVHFILTSETPQPIREQLPPWKLLEGKGYPDVLTSELLQRFYILTNEALLRIRELDRQDWLQQGLFRDKPCNLLDLGTWLANHNIAHIKQIEALREQFTA